MLAESGVAARQRLSKTTFRRLLHSTVPRCCETRLRPMHELYQRQKEEPRPKKRGRVNERDFGAYLYLEQPALFNEGYELWREAGAPCS